MRLPSTKDLRAFELAARLGSIKAAADQLHVSASALSRRIQSLEEELGQSLFVRDARGITLTDVGSSYAEHLRKVFQALETATSAARQQ
ncbi:MAG TPA: LysR family transcriptional regulator, partial [Rhodocyclaceae bacterium]|nr:LysR family transcriptional regulator [Rhodocyclaceae bacterium]